MSKVLIVDDAGRLGSGLLQGILNAHGADPFRAPRGYLGNDRHALDGFSGQA